MRTGLPQPDDAYWKWGIPGNDLMRVYLALGVVLLAILGALLHPLIFLLGVLPLNTLGLESFLSGAKSFIADLLGWGLMGLLVVMAAFVVTGRLSRRRGRSRMGEANGRSPLDDGAARMAVAIIAYNEAEAIHQVVQDFKAQKGVIEVVVVDNNSHDETAALAVLAGARVVSEPRQGYGYACIRALHEALKAPDADVVVLTEGDGTFVGRDVAKFAAYVPQADMVVGTRVVAGLVEKGSQMDHFFTWGNIAVGTLLRFRFWDSQFLGSASLSDVGCTYRAIRRSALQQILPDLTVGGHHFSPHMMLVALYRGLSLIEIPVTFRRRVGVSKGASQSVGKGFKVGLVMIWHILTYRPRESSARPTAGVVEAGLRVRDR